MTFEVYGIVKSKGKRIAVGDNGLFSTDDERIINKLDQLGFKIIEPIKELEPIEEPKELEEIKVIEEIVEEPKVEEVKIEEVVVKKKMGRPKEATDMIITLAQVKSILQISGTTYDTLIAALIPEVQKDVVKYCRNAFVNPNVQLAGTTIAFTTTTITDSDSGFSDALFFSGMDVKVSGSYLNDGIYEVKTVAAGTLTIETAVTQCQPTRVEAVGKEILLTMVDFSKVSKFDVAMLMKYYLAREGKLIKSESLPGGYSVSFKDNPEVFKAFNIYRKPYA